MDEFRPFSKYFGFSACELFVYFRFLSLVSIVTRLSRHSSLSSLVSLVSLRRGRVTDKQGYYIYDDDDIIIILEDPTWLAT